MKNDVMISIDVYDFCVGRVHSMNGKTMNRMVFVSFFYVLKTSDVVVVEAVTGCDDFFFLILSLC